MSERSINRSGDERSFLSVVPLFLRISAQCIRNEQKKRIERLKYTFVALFIYILMIWFFQYDNEMYNALKGPFPIKPDQFIQQIDLHNRQRNFWNRKLFSLSERYFQIELGENHIKKYKTHPFLQLITEPIITKKLHPNRLYVKLATEEQNHYHTRLSFNFQSFSMKTLKCIVRQIQISSIEYNTWIEKSIYIQTIEQFYDRNAVLFNKNVLIQCGILIGYLYHPRDEHQLIETYSSEFNFKLFDVAIDASFSYYSTYFIIGSLLLGGLLMTSVICIVLYIFYCIRRPKIIIHPNTRKQFQILNINCLYSLTTLLHNSIFKKSNYRHHMFIIGNKYLIIFNIDLNEYNGQKLTLFFNESPFLVIPISSIIEVSEADFVINDENDQKRIYFPSIFDDINPIKMSKWLHKQLMGVSPNYRHRYIEAAIKKQEKERYDRQFALIVAREEELQRQAIANNTDRGMETLRSASPRFIAQFCLTNHPSLQPDQNNLLNDQCSICLNEFRVGEKYAQWSCPAPHYFHRECMLRALRESNKCPLCRYAVE